MYKLPIKKSRSSFDTGDENIAFRKGRNYQRLEKRLTWIIHELRLL